MKYKVGDRVLIKSLDWYNKNKDNYGGIYAGNGFGFWKNMTRHCGEIMKITTVKVDPEDSNKGFYFMENSDEKWTDEMIEGLVEEETKPNIIEQAKTYWDSIKDAWICPEGYIFKDENGNEINVQKIVLEKKKMEYPKTYEECCKVLGVNSDNFLSIRNLYRDDGDEELTDYETDLLGKFDSLWELRICRNAYWKIAGEEMGLGKPWEPDWNTSEPKYVIAYTSHGIEKQWETTYCKGLAFPTAEMRDAFYEVFREEIEICKELL